MSNIVQACVLLCAAGAGLAAAWLSQYGTGREHIIALLLLLNVVCLLLVTGRASPIGAVIGLYLVATHIIGWTLLEPGPVLAVAATAYSGLLVVVTLASGRRISSTQLIGWFPLWVGFIPALFSALGAAIAGEWLVAAGRGVVAVSVLGLILVARSGDALRLAWGLLTGVHIGLLAPLACGVAAPVDPLRFWGGACAQMHPNILGMLGWNMAIAWLGLPGASRTGRLFGALSGGTLIFLADSRTSAGAVLVGLAIILAMARTRANLKAARRWRMGRVVAMAVITVAASFVLGSGYFLKERAEGIGVLTGRDRIWGVALDAFFVASTPERLLGTTEGGVGARVVFPDQGATVASVRLVAHNGLLALLRRSGVLGLGAGLLGVMMALQWARRRLRQGDMRAAPVALATLAAAIATIPVEDWFFGGSLFTWVTVMAALVSGKPAPTPNGQRGRPAVIGPR